MKRHHYVGIAVVILLLGFVVLFVARTAARGQQLGTTAPVPGDTERGMIYQMGQMADRQEQMANLMNNLMQNMTVLRQENPSCSRITLDHQDAMLKQMRDQMQQQGISMRQMMETMARNHDRRHNFLQMMLGRPD